jgi:hypothetical protein
MDRETTLPTEILEAVQEKLNDEYTLQEIDDTAIWATSGPVLSAASMGLADDSDKSVYFASGVFAMSMMPEYINEGLIDPKAVSAWVNSLPELPPKE